MYKNNEVSNVLSALSSWTSANELVGPLLARMASYNPPTPLERSLRHDGRRETGIAAANGDIDKFEDLVEVQRKSPKKVDLFLELPLHIAASFGQLDVCKLCLTWTDQSTIDQENFEGCTPLGCACAHGKMEVAEFLVKNGANPQHSSIKTGNTPLHYAAWYGNLDSVAWLLSADLADTKIENNYGCTPFDMAPPGAVRKLLLKHMRRTQDGLA